VAGVLLFGGIRAALYKPDNVHYHANFALYINGTHDDFNNFTFYEEVQSCDSHNLDNPKVRVHMHDQNNALVHVHAHGVTWSQFFTNLGYTLGDNLIKTDKGVYIDGQDGNKLTFILNGKSVDTIANRIIGSEDVLLINYGKDDAATIAQRYQAVPRTAHAQNLEKDPASCGGAEDLTLSARLKSAIGLSSSH